MNTVLADKLESAAMRAQYDEHVKGVLSNVFILAHILQASAKELRGMPLEEIRNCIDPDIEVAKVPVAPGMSNRTSQILGDNTESKIPYEGLITFDIRFHILLPCLNQGKRRRRKKKKQRIKLLINIEAQKSSAPGYAIVTRGVFYGARMISAQQGVEFEIPNYDNIKKVYSIWIVMNAPLYIGNAMTEYTIAKRDLVGAVPDHIHSYDKMTVLTVYLSTRELGEENSIFHLLNVLLSDRMEVQHKKEIIDSVYHIDMDDKLGEEMNIMCNLSEAIEERGIEQGAAQFAALTKVLLADARLEDLQRATDDQNFRKILYEEYHIV